MPSYSECSCGCSTPEAPLKDGLGPDVALLCLSHVDYASGVRLDLPAITALARSHGVRVLWDLSHSAGAVPVQLAEAGAELAVGCTYKYLNAGPGAPAYLYVRSDLQAALRSPIWGWFGQRDQFDMAEAYQPAAGIARFAAGTPSILGIALVESGARLIAEAGIEALEAKSAALTSMMIDLADAWLAPLGFGLATPRDPARRGGHINLAHADARRICRALIEVAGVVPDFRAGPTAAARSGSGRLRSTPVTSTSGTPWTGCATWSAPASTTISVPRPAGSPNGRDDQPRWAHAWRRRRLGRLRREPPALGPVRRRGPAVASLPAAAAGSILLQHRAVWSHHGDTWGLPGGARDSHETAEQAALREAVEESGVDANRSRSPANGSTTTAAGPTRPCWPSPRASWRSARHEPGEHRAALGSRAEVGAAPAASRLCRDLAEVLGRSELSTLAARRATRRTGHLKARHRPTSTTRRAPRSAASRGGDHDSQHDSATPSSTAVAS